MEEIKELEDNNYKVTIDLDSKMLKAIKPTLNGYEVICYYKGNLTNYIQTFDGIYSLNNALSFKLADTIIKIVKKAGWEE